MEKLEAKAGFWNLEDFALFFLNFFSFRLLGFEAYIAFCSKIRGISSNLCKSVKNRRLIFFRILSTLSRLFV
jgi:hypothetical protein